MADLTTPGSIAAACEAAGITRYRLAQLVGVHPSTVLRWDSGHNKMRESMQQAVERALAAERRRQRRAEGA